MSIEAGERRKIAGGGGLLRVNVLFKSPLHRTCMIITDMGEAAGNPCARQNKLFLQLHIIFM